MERWTHACLADWFLCHHELWQHLDPTVVQMLCPTTDCTDRHSLRPRPHSSPSPFHRLAKSASIRTTPAKRATETTTAEMPLSNSMLVDGAPHSSRRCWLLQRLDPASPRQELFVICPVGFLANLATPSGSIACCPYAHLRTSTLAATSVMIRSFPFHALTCTLVVPLLLWPSPTSCDPGTLQPSLLHRQKSTPSSSQDVVTCRYRGTLGPFDTSFTLQIRQCPSCVGEAPLDFAA